MNALLPDDTNNADDVYRFELNTNALTRVSFGAGGAQGTVYAGAANPDRHTWRPACPPAGAAIAFHSHLGGLTADPGATARCTCGTPGYRGVKVVPRRLPRIDTFALGG